MTVGKLFCSVKQLKEQNSSSSHILEIKFHLLRNPRPRAQISDSGYDLEGCWRSSDQNILDLFTFPAMLEHCASKQ
jgi:hypothetical protein